MTFKWWMFWCTPWDGEQFFTTTLGLCIDPRFLKSADSACLQRQTLNIMKHINILASSSFSKGHHNFVELQSINHTEKPSTVSRSPAWSPASTKSRRLSIRVSPVKCRSLNHLSRATAAQNPGRMRRWRLKGHWDQGLWMASRMDWRIEIWWNMNMDG